MAITEPEEEYLRVELFDKDLDGVDPIGKCSVFIRSLFQGKCLDPSVVCLSVVP